ncbi:MAG: Hsp20/alpha crystallin family protein [Oscillospiraceae bacterium]|nr:Hsp20/alpha crystallin family protein [Oscillospiraceae bacterium]MCI6972925.1 Hsp20/alpha crystallin family protein [Clostridiales bacterium]MDY2909816.1 Hsp20/alpha crystallin family protein [Oscillospiraceae bacterium]
MFEIMPYGHRRVVAYNPFRELEEMSRSFWNDTNLNAFRTDITEKDGVYTLTAELPGFKKEDISIDIDKDCLTIAAERKDESEDEDKERNYVRRERFYGSYSRSFNVKGIDTEAINASYADGILTLTMPSKTPETPPTRRLEIQ